MGRGKNIQISGKVHVQGLHRMAIFQGLVLENEFRTACAFICQTSYQARCGSSSSEVGLG